MLVELTKKRVQVPEERHVGRKKHKNEFKFRRNGMLVEKNIKMNSSSGGTTCW